MKTDDFQKLKDRVEQELKITEDNIMDKSIQLSNMYSIILNIYTKELKNLKFKKADMDKLYGEIYHVLKKEGYEGHSVDSKTEATVYINSDPRFYPLRLEYAQLEIQVQYLEKTLSLIDNLGFRIKNFIDLQKLKKGIF